MPTYLKVDYMMVVFRNCLMALPLPSISRLALVYMTIVCLFLVCWQTFGTGSISWAWDDLSAQPYPSRGGIDSLHTTVSSGTALADDDTGVVPGANSALEAEVPPNTRVIGLVFYGRRQYVQILDCYLKRNIKSNGGLLDEVIFAVKTENGDDLKFLKTLVETAREYTRYDPSSGNGGYGGSWESVLTGENDIIIKIDDDVVFIEDNAIPAIVKRLIENPSFFAVSANVINNPALSWIHRGMGLYEPYFPEMKNFKEDTETASWRSSELPSYQGSPNGPKNFKIDGTTPAPYEGHRWLPVRRDKENEYDILKTPASLIEFNAFGPSLDNWAIGAQTHYSFLQHLEEGETWRYKFDIWDYHYQRLSINFLGIRRGDVIASFPFPVDDEEYLTVVRPKELGRHVVVEGGGLAVHFAFGPQYRAHGGRGLSWTDALGRYRAYAEEMVCPPLNKTKRTMP